MKTKYIFVTGGVVSSLGKGIAASSVARLLKNRGLKVFMQKFDPYINVDPSTMSPLQHGEVFVTEDGAEADLDLGHYERFIDEKLTKDSTITAGKIYKSVIEKERRGDYLGRTVQVIPHITDEIKSKIRSAAKTSKADVIITEIGGTVGDIEGLPFLEAIRQWCREVGSENTFFIHNTLVPYLRAAKEIKTKPTQHSVKELRSLGIQPDMIILRTEVNIDREIKEKIALFCDVDKKAVVQATDANILYEVALNLQKQHVDDYICNYFHLETPEADMTEWMSLITKIKELKGEIKIALVGKYVELHDAYLSVHEALKHAGYEIGKKINVKWIKSDDINDENASELLKDVNGIFIPGEFGTRSAEGEIAACKYARVNNIPYFGICLGMEVAAIEFARNVLGLADANSVEYNPETKNPVVHVSNALRDTLQTGGPLRIGAYKTTIKEGTILHSIYNKEQISERYRNRYELNNDYLCKFSKNGLMISAVNEELDLVDAIEIPNHPWFVGCQFHPEFLSRPNRPHPLFEAFVNSANENANKN